MKSKSKNTASEEILGISKVVLKKRRNPLTNFEEAHGKVSETQAFKQNSKEYFQIRKNRSRKSFDLTKTVQGEVNKQIIKASLELDTLQKCRSALNKLIEKDKKYGKVLKKIKEVYEKHLDPQYKENHSEIPEKLKISKKIDEIKKLTKSVSHSRSHSLLINTKQVSAPINHFKPKDSCSTMDTIYNSPRNIIPELAIGAIPRSEFHQEFMANYDNFSESWRKLMNNIKK